MTVSSALEKYEDLCKLMPGGVNSPVRAAKAMKHPPLIAERALRDKIYDAEGNAFIDYCGSWGALIHGHAHPVVVKAVQLRAELGTTFGATTELEGELAKKVLSAYPSMERVRFVSSGTEATMSAARLARGVTGRDLIIKFSGHYHGHADLFLVNAGSAVAQCPSASSAGVPKASVANSLSIPFNDFHSFQTLIQNEEIKKNLAAVIVEPVAANMGVVPPADGFLEMVRKETENCGALLIFDEVVTGFRLGLGGAQELLNIKPDLTCLGKIVGGGLPAAAFGGKKEIMDYLSPIGNVFQAGTLSGNPLAMEAGLQALELLSEDNFYKDLEEKANIITKPVEEAIEKLHLNMAVQQIGSMFTIFFGQKKVANFDEAKACDMDAFAAFFRFLYSKGIYIPPLQLEPWFISSAHTEEHLNYTKDVVLDFLENSSEYTKK